jgi:AGZA family xanthine/uracil permease-like MFS transporter
MAKRVKGAILIGVIATTVFAILLEAIVNAGQSGGTDHKGWNLGYPALPDQVVDSPNLSLLGDVNFDAWVQVPILTAVLIVFTLVLTDFFDTIGTMTGLGKEANLLDAEGRLPNTGKALFVDAVGAVAGGAASSSSNTVYIESAAGIAEGARTGLANVVTGLLFIAAMFFTPLYSSVPVEAAAPALVIVGVLMMAQIKEIDFSDFTIALPAFLTIVVMPFTYSIANGIGAGFISYVLLRSVTGRAREIHLLMWIVAAAFVVYFAIGPIQAAIG